MFSEVSTADAESTLQAARGWRDEVATSCEEFEASHEFIPESIRQLVDEFDREFPWQSEPRKAIGVLAELSGLIADQGKRLECDLPEFRCTLDDLDDSEPHNGLDPEIAARWRASIAEKLHQLTTGKKISRDSERKRVVALGVKPEPRAAPTAGQTTAKRLRKTTPINPPTPDQYTKLNMEMLRSRELNGLTLHAYKFFFNIVSLYNGFNNGDLSAAMSVMKNFGWKNEGMVTECRKELVTKGFLFETRREPRATTLYAITSQPLSDQCSHKFNTDVSQFRVGMWKRDTATPTTAKTVSPPASQIHQKAA